jgi:hypothetical protein
VPTIESEGKFIKVAIKLVILNAAPVSSGRPSLKKRSHNMDARHEFMRQFRATADHRDMMLVSRFHQIRIA